MTIACPKCGRAHTLPDGSSDNKRIFFLCSQCSHKVIVDGRKHFTTGTQGTVSFRETEPRPTISSIIESTACLFSAPTFLLSLVFSLASFLFLSVVSFAVIKNISFLLTNPALLAGIGAVTFFTITYVSIILFYLIAKIRYFKADHPFADTIDWKFITFDLPEDSLTLLLFFVCVPLAALLILLPVYALNEWGLLYTAFALILFVPLVFFCVLFSAFFRVIPAVVAGKALYLRQTISSLFSFAFREALNIPVYLILIDLISFVISLAVLSLFFITVVVTIAGFSLVLDPSLTAQIRAGVSSASFTGIAGIAAIAGLSFPVKAGLVIISLVLLLVIIAVYSFILTIRQNLIAQACWIMYSNPGKSVPRYVMILIMSAIALTMMGAFTFLPFLKLLSR
jgi:DNA-directed RNA polymerase subunit RPC12/RpoP